MDDVNTKLARFLTRNMMVVVNFIYFWSNMVKFLENMKNPRTENLNWNGVWWMILSIGWGLMIVIGAENKWPRVFLKWIKKSWSLSFVFLPVEAGIEFNGGVFPVVVWGLLEHQRPLWKVFDHPACSGMLWNSLPKSTCIKSKLNFEFWVRSVTSCCLWSASCLWCIWMMFEWSELNLLKPSYEFEF